MKYRADPLLDGLYVCLHPRKGRIFASDLTYKTDDGIESILHGPGMYACTYACNYNIVNCALYKVNMYHISMCHKSAHTP